jgi:hypothetical protein
MKRDWHDPDPDRIDDLLYAGIVLTILILIWYGRL